MMMIQVVSAAILSIRADSADTDQIAVPAIAVAVLVSVSAPEQVENARRATAPALPRPSPSTDAIVCQRVEEAFRQRRRLERARPSHQVASGAAAAVALDPRDDTQLAAAAVVVGQQLVHAPRLAGEPLGQLDRALHA